MRKLYLLFVYYFSWLLFGLVGLTLNIACIPLLLLPHRERHARTVRRVIKALFDFWVRWFHACGVVRIFWHGFDEAPLSAGVVYVANHPSLVDATFVLARLPDAFCIFKPALMRNPAIGPAAVMGGYISGDAGVDLLREAAEKVAAGLSLLIFPEGTRTGPGTSLEPLKAGFALIANRAHAPVRLIVIRTTPGLVARGQRWWRQPAKLPAEVHLTLDREWAPDPRRHASDLSMEVESRLRDVLGA